MSRGELPGEVCGEEEGEDDEPFSSESPRACGRLTEKPTAERVERELREVAGDTATVERVEREWSEVAGDDATVERVERELREVVGGDLSLTE